MPISRRSLIKLVAAGIASAVYPKKAVAAETEKLVQFSPSVAVEIAAKFAEANAPCSLTATNPIPIFDASGEQCGWSVDFQHDNIQSGYLILDANEPELISQFSFTDGALNPYAEIAKDLPSNHSSLALNPSIVKMSPFDFCAIDPETSRAIGKSGSSFSIKTDAVSLLSGHTTTWDKIMIPESKVYGNGYSIQSSNVMGDLYYVSESKIENEVGRYACAVMALYTVAGITVVNNSGFLINPYTDFQEFLSIWDYTNTYAEDDSSSANGIIYGTTDDVEIGRGFQEYCASKGHSQPYVGVISPSITPFTTHVASHKPSIYSVRINTTGGKSGHSMTVAGVATLSDGTTSFDTLYVYDGWSKMTYLKFRAEGFASSYGTFFQ